MKIRVYTKIGRQEGILGWDGERITARVDAPPIEGAANDRLINLLSEWFGLSKSKVTIIKGHTSRYKTVEINVAQEQLNNLISELPRLPSQQKLF